MKQVTLRNSLAMFIKTLLDILPAKNNSEAQNIFELLGKFRNTVEEYGKEYQELLANNQNNPEINTVLQNCADKTFKLLLDSSLYEWLNSFVLNIFERHPAVKEQGLVGDDLKNYFKLKEDLKNVEEVEVTAN